MAVNSSLACSPSRAWRCTEAALSASRSPASPAFLLSARRLSRKHSHSPLPLSSSFRSVEASLQTERPNRDVEKVWSDVSLGSSGSQRPNGAHSGTASGELRIPEQSAFDGGSRPESNGHAVETAQSRTVDGREERSGDGNDSMNGETLSSALEKAKNIDIDMTMGDGDFTDSEGFLDDSKALKGTLAFGALVVGTVAALGFLGYTFREDLSGYIDVFTTYIEGAGPAGYVTFTLGYAALEVLAVPALPLTMSAGVLFGPALGTLLCSLAGTLSATVAFLIARYVARDRILELVKGNKKYLAVDRAVGEDSFRIVTLLRLSPLLPFSLGNYIYGLTSVKLLPYVLGTWIGMIPGTWAYVSAGAFGRTLLEADSGTSVIGDSSLYSLVGGLALTAFAATYVTNVAKKAMTDSEED
eukprot:TRINITY_DN21410_c0_g1_i1.p1 TRINITY_DN21410_c0_g1~~TRINITY_DN21410_c0_g1_i1.p1  ORF type:complete len:414 (-),score=12.43 TRINITY_DN21410_c0_g1_i1:26-1267(-)